uniref:Oxidoreductase n=1 Tax=Schlesneria paludicola TaxID=360056 RepID=A0A7C2JWX0_9PLAN
MASQSIFYGLALIVVGAPMLLVAVLGISSLVDRRLNEDTISRSMLATTWIGLVASLAILAVMLVVDTRRVAVPFGNWVAIADSQHHVHYHMFLKVEFDRLSIPFLILSFLLCGTIGSFAGKYMHREPGFNRFYMLYAIFLLGMVTTSIAGTIETLFTGWELVGLSSALLVAFFHERPAPVRNGLRVWTVYRISDAALLMAAVALHHLKGEGNFDVFLGDAPWPEGHTLLTSSQAFWVGMLLLAAAAGKSALVPFSGWLPRAMEGPTPSSAVFYGALSVHLGAFLLLRVSPLLEASPALCIVVLLIGLATALVGTLSARVQTDIKSALSFASLTQVGIIVAEIGGLRLLPGHSPEWVSYVPLVHILGHGCLRTLQFVRAPSLLLDYKELENAIGGRLSTAQASGPRRLSDGLWLWLYRFAFDRGYLDVLLDRCAAAVRSALRRCDAWEHRWISFLSGEELRRSEQVDHMAAPIEELT